MEYPHCPVITAAMGHRKMRVLNLIVALNHSVELMGQQPHGSGKQVVYGSVKHCVLWLSIVV